MNSFTKHKIFKLRSVNNEGPVNVVKFKGLNVETPFVALTVSVHRHRESSKTWTDSPWVLSVSNRNHGFGLILLCLKWAVMCRLHLVVYNSAFPQAPTRGQDDTPDLRGGREGCMCACVEGGLLPSFRSTRFISWCSSWLMLTLSLRKFWPQMFPKIQSIFFSSFSDNNSIVLLIYNPLTAWLLPLFWHLMLKFGAVIIQHFILALLSKKNSSWFVASMQGKKK